MSKNAREIAQEIVDCWAMNDNGIGLDEKLQPRIAAAIEAEREAAKVLVEALEEAQCELFRIAEAPWDIHQAQVAAESGRYRLGERLARYKELVK